MTRTPGIQTRGAKSAFASLAAPALAAVLLGLAGCANQKGDLGASLDEAPVIRNSTPENAPPSAQNPIVDSSKDKTSKAAAEVVDVSAPVGPASVPAGRDAGPTTPVVKAETVEVASAPEKDTPSSTPKDPKAELVSVRPAGVPEVGPAVRAETKAPGIAETVAEVQADDKKEPAPPVPPPPTPPAEETPEQRAARLLKERERLASIDEQAKGQEADAAYQAGLKLFNDLEYEEALKYFERALAFNPGHVEAGQKRLTVRQLLGIHADRVRGQIMELERVERVKIQETMMELARALEEARRLEERGSEAAIEPDITDKSATLARQLESLQQAQDHYKRVVEVLNWMPPSVELPGLRARVEGSLKTVRSKIAAKNDEISFLNRMLAQQESEKERKSASDLHVQRINKLLAQVKELYEQQNFKAAERLAIRILQIDPLNPVAESWKNKSRAAFHSKEGLDLEKLKRDETKRSWEDIDEASISYAPLVQYPPNWDQISRRSEQSLGGGRAAEEAWKTEIRKKLQRKVTFEFVDTPLEEAISFLRQLAQVTMIVDPKVTAGGAAPAINLRVTDMSLDLALDWILKLADLEYALKDQAIFISKPSSLIESNELKIYDVSDLTQTIQDFPGPEFQIDVGNAAAGAGGGGGGGLFTAAPKAVVTLTNIADMIRNRVRPEKWDPALGTSIEERGGKLVVMQTPEIHRLVDQLLANFRATQKMMINIEARFLTIREAYLEDIGVEFHGLDPNVLFGDFGDIRRLAAPTGFVQPRVPGGGDATPPNAPFPGIVNGPDRVLSGSFSQVGSIINHTIGFFNNDPDTISGNDAANTVRQGGFSGQVTVLNNMQVQAFIRALAVRENTSTLIAPRLTVFNTQRAHMFVARQQSYVADYEISGDSYDPVIRQFLVGVVLDVKPIVSSDRRYVTLELRPTVTELVNFTTRQIDSFAVNSGAQVNVFVQLAFPIQFPELSIRRVRTTATVPDGGILLIGGLYRNIRFNAENGVPFLSDLPVIGRLFRWNVVDNAKSNLAILVSPRIIIFSEEEEKL